MLCIFIQIFVKIYPNYKNITRVRIINNNNKNYCQSLLYPLDDGDYIGEGNIIIVININFVGAVMKL